MQMRLFTVEPALQAFIKVICSMESGGADDKQPPFRVLPDTCTEIFINYIETGATVISGKSSKECQSSFIVSRMNRFMDVHSPERAGTISICFYPGAARHFFALPMDEMANEVLDLHYLWKGLISEIEERVITAKSNQDRVAILQEYLLKQLEKNYKADKAIEYCLWQLNFAKGLVNIGALSDSTGMSNRQLLRRFNNLIGLSPKEFARITRFISSLDQLRKYPDLSLTEIAYECGYYDQAHFIHDYKEFAGCSPRQLLSSTCTIY